MLQVPKQFTGEVRSSVYFTGGWVVMFTPSSDMVTKLLTPGRGCSIGLRQVTQLVLG